MTRNTRPFVCLVIADISSARCALNITLKMATSVPLDRQWVSKTRPFRGESYEDGFGLEYILDWDWNDEDLSDLLSCPTPWWLSMLRGDNEFVKAWRTR